MKDFTTNKVEIVSMNHGFALDRETLPANAQETHVSLFDGSNCGIALTDRPAFSVQHHPEASPGPRDSHYLFKRFVETMEKTAPPAERGSARARRRLFFGQAMDLLHQHADLRLQLGVFRFKRLYPGRRIGGRRGRLLRRRR